MPAIKALVVENDENWRHAISDCLVQMGITVRAAEDAETAIDCLKQDMEVKVLMLDWDLRRPPIIPTALGEDVLRSVISKRPDVTVIIATGAFRDEEFTKWLVTQSIDPADELFRIHETWQPFLLLSKNRLLDGGTLQEQAAKGLPRLAEILKAKRLFETVAAKAPFVRRKGEKRVGHTAAVAPFQYCKETDRLRGDNGVFTAKVRLRLQPVLKHLLGISKDLVEASATGSITKYVLAAAYTDGKLRELRPRILKRLKAICQGKAYQEECERILARLASTTPWENEDAAVLHSFLERCEVADGPLGCLLNLAKRLREPDVDKLCAAFSTDFHRWQRDNLGLLDKDALVRSVSGEGYVMGAAWNRMHPIFRHSFGEAPKEFKDDLLPGSKGKRGGAPLTSPEEDVASELDENSSQEDGDESETRWRLGEDGGE